MVSPNLSCLVVWINILCTVESLAPLGRRQKKNEGNVRSAVLTLLTQSSGANHNNSRDDGMDQRYFVCRRDLLHLTLVGIGVQAIEDMFPKLLPTSACAAYGDSTNIELPSYIDFLIEKNKQADPSTFLYQGADRDAQLSRLKTAISYLETLPTVVRSRKWSQVQGIITGPLGTLTTTMRQLSESNQEAQKAAGKVKLDLFNIGLCSTSKDEAACLAASEAALKDLADFIKIAL